MTSLLSPIDAKLAELRNVFDRARALPFSAQAVEQTENLLAIRVSRDGYAIRVNEIAGLTNDKKIITVPSSIPELLGIAGVRGTLVSVYCLSALLGYGPEEKQTRWLALCGTEDPVGLAFHNFEGYVQVSRVQFHAAKQKDATQKYVTHMTGATGALRAVISIPLVREAIQKRCGNNTVLKER